MGLPAGAYSPYRLSLKDISKEIGTFSVYGLLLDAETWDDNQALATSFFNSLNAITLGVAVEQEYGTLNILNPVGFPSSSSAQRENKLLVRFYDSTTYEKFTATIPTIDTPNLVFETDAKDFVSKTVWGAGGAVMTTFVTNWQAFVVNPRTNNLTTISSLEFVGRNT